MKIARKEGTNQLVTPQSKIVGESGVDTKSSVGELEKLNNATGKTTGNTTGNTTKNETGSATKKNVMVDDGYVKKLDYLGMLKAAVVRAYIFGPLTLGHFIGIRTMLMSEVDKQSIPINILASSLTWYGTYGLFKGKKHALLFVFGGIGLHFFKIVKEESKE